MDNVVEKNDKRKNFVETCKCIHDLYYLLIEMIVKKL